MTDITTLHGRLKRQKAMYNAHLKHKVNEWADFYTTLGYPPDLVAAKIMQRMTSEQFKIFTDYKINDTIVELEKYYGTKTL